MCKSLPTRKKPCSTLAVERYPLNKSSEIALAQRISQWLTGMNTSLLRPPLCGANNIQSLDFRNSWGDTIYLWMMVLFVDLNICGFISMSSFLFKHLSKTSGNFRPLTSYFDSRHWDPWSNRVTFTHWLKSEKNPAIYFLQLLHVMCMFCALLGGGFRNLGENSQIIP